MSTTVDQRVVEMRFDNAQFEKNVHTSMSTLDKLKQKLNLSGATKGLETIEKTANGIRFDGMIDGIETVNARFSYLQGTIQHQINKITDSIVNAGRKIVSSVTTQPIKDGFSEYETQMNAVQTILANTQKEGTTVKTVNAALDELNTYADKTIYNFTEMTRNIGTFTAAGVKLDTSVSAIQGIANLAAVSGSTSQQASTAMYQLSQALASGTVKLMDWNSVVNAGMGGQVFQDALTRTSELLGTGAKAAIKAKGSFRESLSTGWLTTEVLTQTLDQFSTAADTQEEYEAAVKKFVEQGYSKEEAKSIADMARTAGDAATKVKTFTQLIDTLKEAMGSGWTTTWRLVIGDFEEAKELWSGISDVLSEFINKTSEARNTLLTSAFGKGFSEMSNKMKDILNTVSEVTEPVKDAVEVVEEVSTAISDLGTVVDDVILGKFGNGQDRLDALTKSGINYYEVQNRVNEKLGDSFRYTKDQIDAQDKLLNTEKKVVKTTEQASDATEGLTDSQKEQLKELVKLNDAQLRSKGLTEDQVQAFKDLRSTASKLGIPIDKFIDQLDQINGRWLMIEGFKNIGRAIAKVFGTMSKAANEVFDAIKPKTIFNALGAFHKLTSALILSDSNADKLKRTFKGLFSILDTIKTIVSGSVTIAFRVLGRVLSKSNVNILDFTARLGDAVVKLQDFLLNNKYINSIIDKGSSGIEKLAKTIGQMIDAIFNNPITDEIASIWDTIFGESNSNKTDGIVKGLKEIGIQLDFTEGQANNFNKVFEGILAGLDASNWWFAGSLTSGLKLLNAVLQLFGTNLANVGGILADYVIKFRDWVTEHTIFMGVMDKLANVLATLISGIQSCASAFLQLDIVRDIIADVQEVLIKFFGDTEKGFESVNIEGFCSKIRNAFSDIKSWIESLNNSENLGRDIVYGIANGIAKAVDVAADAITTIAITIKDTFCALLGIHSPSKWGYDQGIWIVKGIVNGLKAAIALVKKTVLSVVEAIKESFTSLKIDVKFDEVLGSIKRGAEKFSEFVKNFNFKYLLSIIPVAVVLVTLKKIFDLTLLLKTGLQSVNGVIDSFKKIEDNIADTIKAYKQQIQSKALKNIAVSIAILVGSVIALTRVDSDKLDDAVATVVLLAGVMAGLAVAMSKLETASVNLDKKSGIKVGGIQTTVLTIAASLLLLAGSIKIIGSMTDANFAQGLAGLAASVGALAALIVVIGLIGKYGDLKSINTMSTTMVGLSVAVLLMSVAVKQISKLTPDDIEKGISFVTAFIEFIAVLGIISRYSGSEIGKIGGLMIKLSVAMALMVGVIKLIGLLQVSEIIKGYAFALAFAVFVGAVVLVSKLFPRAQIQKVSGLVLSITVSMMLMVGVCKLVSLLSVGEMAKGAAFAGAFLVFVGILVRVTRISKEEQTAKLAATILSMSIAIGALAAICILLGLVDTKMLVKGASAVVALGLMMTAMIWATRGANDCKKNLIVMTAAIALMTASIVILGNLKKTEDLANATIALATLMGTFTIMSKIAGSANGSLKAAVGMLAITAALSALLYAIGKLGIDDAVTNAEALSVLLVSLAVSIQLMDGLQGCTKDVYKSVAAMIGVMTVIAVVLKIVDTMNVQANMKTVLALSTLLLALSASTVILSQAKTVSTTALAAVGVMTGVLAGIGIILGVMQALDVAPNIKTVLALSTLLLALSASTVILSVAGLLGPAGLVGVKILTSLMLNVGALMMAIGGLATLFPKVEEFIDKGIPLLGKIGEGIGSFFGGITKGVSSLVTDSLVDLGSALSSFMANASGFFDGISKVKPTAAQSATSLADMIMTLTKSDLMSGISKWLGFGGTDFDELGTMLSNFGTAMIRFSRVVSGNIDTDAVQAASDAGNMMATLEKSLPKTGGFLEDILGTSDIEDFGERCAAFGEAIVKFSNTVSANGGVNSDAVQVASDAGTLVSELEDSLPRQGGALQKILGSKEIGGFGESCAAFGEAITKFSNSVTVDTDVIDKATSAGEAFAALEEAIPESGWFDGKVDLDEFGRKIVSFGGGLNSFAAKIEGVEFASVKTAITQADRLVELTADISGIETDGIGNFAKVNEIASTMATFGTKVSGMPADIVSSSISSAIRLKNFITSLVGLDTSGIESFNISNIGNQLASYWASVSSIDPLVLSTSVTSAMALANFISSLSGIDSNGVVSFVDSIGILGTASVDSFVIAFETAGSRLSTAVTSLLSAMSVSIATNAFLIVDAFDTMFTTVSDSVVRRSETFESEGSKLISYLCAGMKSELTAVKSAIASLLEGSEKSIRSHHSGFSSAGRYLGDGLILGINNKKSAVYQAAYALGQEAVRGEADGQKSQSPSKLTEQAGIWLGEGLVIGINKMGQAVYSAGHNMGNNAARSISGALTNINNMPTGDFVPSIRPVVDLGELQNGRSTLRIGADLSAHLLSKPVDSLQQIVSDAQESINASNSEVIQAINELRNDLNGYYNGDDNEIALYMDSKKVASTLAKPMNRELNILARRGY